MIERISIMCDVEDLEMKYDISPSEIEDLSDLDLLELFEEVHGLNDPL
jgi:hypothetical protein